MTQREPKILIKNGKIIDGSGNPWFYGDVLVEGEKISAVLQKPSLEDPSSNQTFQSPPEPGISVIDATGCFVTPGFIDIHSHSDIPLFIDGKAQSVIRQGVTTQIVGNCGGWSFPLKGETRLHAEIEAKRYGYADHLPWETLAQYMEVLESRGISINVGVLAGHGAIRASVSGFAARPLSRDELEACKKEISIAMEQGAMGMSTGLYYAPGSYAPAQEIVELAKVVAEYGGIHASHIRDESNYSIGLMAALDEVINISAASGVKTEISHLKCLGPATWGKSAEVLAKIEKARSLGLDVTADQYPYVASGSSITGALIPRWAQEGTREDLLTRLKTPAVRGKLKSQVEENLDRRGGAERLKIASYPPQPELAGLTLAEVAARMDVHPAEAALILLEKSDASFVSFVMDEDDVRTIMKAPFVMTASDGWALSKDGPLSAGHPHPRSFGTFVRVISKYALAENVITLEDAIRKMTSLPANRLGLRDRGLLRPGFFADIVVFDPSKIKDQATFDEPKSYASGVKYVLVNGSITIDESEHTGAKKGKVLKGPGYKS